MSTAAFVGIDISQARLDVAVRPGVPFSVLHDEAGIAVVVAQLRDLAPTLIVMEATGALETALTSAVVEAALPVVVANPRQIRDFAKAAGHLAKTDRLDAEILAHFAEVMHPVPRPLPDAEARSLAALWARRRQLVEMLTAEKNRLLTAPVSIRKSLRAHIAWLEREMAHTDTALHDAIQRSPVWREKEQLLRTVPGVGPVLTSTLLAHLPELGTS